MLRRFIVRELAKISRSPALLWLALHRHERTARRAGFAITALLVAGLGLHAVFKVPAEWSDVYVPAARALLNGGDIYAEGTGYLYPPFAALLAIPFAPLPNVPIRLVWYLCNVAAIVYFARSAWTIGGGQRLASATTTDPREMQVLAIGALCSVTYGLNTLAHQQTDLVIGALVFGGCAALLAGRGVLGAILIGLGAAFKGPPLLFAAYFAFRRNWLASALIVATALSVNLLPDLVNHPVSGTWLGRWLGRYVLPTAHIDTTLGTWGSALIYNQSLVGTLQRIVNTGLVWGPAGLEVVGRPVLGNRSLKTIAYGVMIGMLVVSAWAGQRGRRERSEARQHVEFPGVTAFECALVVLLMLLMSPMSGLAHFAVLALPGLCLARVAVFGRSRFAIWSLAIAAVAAVSLNKDLVGGVAYNAILWGGGATAGTLALWVGCVLALATGSASPAASGVADSR